MTKGHKCAAFIKAIMVDLANSVEEVKLSLVFILYVAKT